MSNMSFLLRFFLFWRTTMQKYEVQLLQSKMENREQAAYCQVGSLQSSSQVYKGLCRVLGCWLDNE